MKIWLKTSVCRLSIHSHSKKSICEPRFFSEFSIFSLLIFRFFAVWMSASLNRQNSCWNLKKYFFFILQNFVLCFKASTKFSKSFYSVCCWGEILFAFSLWLFSHWESINYELNTNSIHHHHKKFEITSPVHVPIIFIYSPKKNTLQFSSISPPSSSSSCSMLKIMCTFLATNNKVFFS